MTRTLALLLACCLPLAACTQSSTPPAASAQAAADPAQLALDAWLEAFNANDRARLAAFRDRYLPTFDVDGMLEFHLFEMDEPPPEARLIEEPGPA